MGKAHTPAARRRAVHREALIEYISKQKLVNHIVKVAAKLGDETVDIPPEMVTRYKVAIDANLKLISKYLPDVRSVELTGEDGGPVQVQSFGWKDE